MNIDEAELYERSRRLSNIAVWTVEMQSNRLKRNESEDAKFTFRFWADLQFLIVALSRLRRAAQLAADVPELKIRVEQAIDAFDSSMPDLKKMRNVAEHIDDYARGKGRDKSVKASSLEVAGWDGDYLEWLGYKLNLKDALNESAKLFGVISDLKTVVKEGLNKTA